MGGYLPFLIRPKHATQATRFRSLYSTESYVSQTFGRQVATPGDTPNHQATVSHPVARVSHSQPKAESITSQELTNDCRLCRACRKESVSDTPTDWQEIAGFLDKLSANDLPPTPFRMNANTTVHDAEKFLLRLRRDAARGASGPRAQFNAVQADVNDLRRIVAEVSTRDPSSAPGIYIAELKSPQHRGLWGD